MFIIAWLSGYDQRIKLTIDNTKIDGALSDFPVTIFFTSTQGEEIFTEFDADSDYMKCAFTSSDGTTQLYAEKELFDDSEQKAIYHVKVTSVASGADTDIYYYYDNDHADNDTYIGAINTAAGASVWDNNYVFVCHGVDATTSTLYDSTTNNNDGTKTAANNPNEIAGDIGKSQDFGGDDYINVSDSAELSANDYFTVEAMTILDVDNADMHLIIKGDDLATAVDNYSYRLTIALGNYVKFGVSQTGLFADETVTTTHFTISTATLYYLAGKNDGTNVSVFVNDVEITEATNKTVFDSTSDIHIGARYDNSESIYKYFLNGKVDEIRISRIDRTDAWMNATCDSLKDALLTYGSEEAAEEEANAVWFGMNF